MKRYTKIVLIVIITLIAGMAAYRFTHHQSTPIQGVAPSPAVMTEQPLVTSDDGKYQLGDTLAPSEESKAYRASSKMVDGYKETAWEALVPANWDPMAPLKELKVDELDDSDPRAIAALDKAMKFWSAAPTNPDINGQSIRIPGFVVVLENHQQKTKEFLLVPYFGACIHTPPPPANQIIYVKSSQPIAHLKSMDTVWIQGKIHIEKADTSMGKSGYTMQADKVMPYEY